MKIVKSAKIDWLTFTCVMGREAVQPQNVYFARALAIDVLSDVYGDGNWSVDFERQEGFYPWVFKVNPTGATMAISSDIHKQGVRFVMPGKATSDQWQVASVLASLSGMGWRCTRVDVAIDVVGVAYDWDDIEKTMRSLAKDKGRSIAVFGNNSGKTVVVGARTSSTMVRAYNKGAEQNVDYPWVRVEAEIKGDVARALWDCGEPLFDAAMRHATGWMDGWEHELHGFMVEACDAPPGVVKVPRKGLTDRERWLDASVLPALRTLALDDIDAARAWVDKAKALIDAVEMMG